MEQSEEESSGSLKRQSVVADEVKVTAISAKKVQDVHVTEAEQLPSWMIDIQDTRIF